jgi:hypothetical protein
MIHELNASRNAVSVHAEVVWRYPFEDGHKSLRIRDKGDEAAVDLVADQHPAE